MVAREQFKIIKSEPWSLLLPSPVIYSSIINSIYSPGELLGGEDENDMGLLSAFVALLDFEDKDLVAALRLFMGTFLVPGEAQKISRIIRTLNTEALALHSLIEFVQRYLQRSMSVRIHVERYLIETVRLF